MTCVHMYANIYVVNALKQKGDKQFGKPELWAAIYHGYEHYQP